MDSFILFVILAMGYAFYRRLVLKPKEMELSQQSAYNPQPYYP